MQKEVLRGEFVNAATGGKRELLLGLLEMSVWNLGGGWSGSGVFFVTPLQAKSYKR